MQSKPSLHPNVIVMAGQVLLNILAFIKSFHILRNGHVKRLWFPMGKNESKNNFFSLSAERQNYGNVTHIGQVNSVEHWTCFKQRTEDLSTVHMYLSNKQHFVHFHFSFYVYRCAATNKWHHLLWLIPSFGFQAALPLNFGGFVIMNLRNREFAQPITKFCLPKTNGWSRVKV